MIEGWWRWRYRRYERRTESTDNFAEFERFASGPWTTDVVRKMPWDVLVKGPQMGAIDAQTRRVIDLEIERRNRPRLPIVQIIIALASLALALEVAIFK